MIKIKGFTPHKDQRKVINSIIGDDAKYHILTTGRQWGKTLMSINLLLKWTLENPKSVGMWVAPVYSQSKKVFEEIIDVVVDTPILKSINKSDLEIRFTNNSKILFKSGERPDNLRGYTLDYLVVDEAAFLKEDIWDKALKPTTMVKGKKVLFISTPKGKNFFYSLHIKGKNDEVENYKSYQGSSYNSPYITKEELIEAKNSLPEDIYRQEILGEFIDTGGEVFKDIDNFCILNAYPSYQPSQKYYAGLDFGRQNDYSVMIILNEFGEVVELYRERKKSWDSIIRDIIILLKKYKPKAIAEVNSIGDVLYERINKEYRIEPFITNNASKQNIIEELLYNLNTGVITLPSKSLSPELYGELKNFTYTYSPKTRKIVYGAISGSHDDIVMALSIASYAKKTMKNKGKYLYK